MEGGETTTSVCVSVCVGGKGEEGAHPKLPATKSFTIPTKCTSQALTLSIYLLMLSSHKPKPITPWSIISKRRNNTPC